MKTAKQRKRLRTAQLELGVVRTGPQNQSTARHERETKDYTTAKSTNGSKLRREETEQSEATQARRRPAAAPSERHKLTVAM